MFASGRRRLYAFSTHIDGHLLSSDEGSNVYQIEQVGQASGDGCTWVDAFDLERDGHQPDAVIMFETTSALIMG